MADIKKYWALVAEHRAKLMALGNTDLRGMSLDQIHHLSSREDVPVWITSVEDPMTGGIGDKTCAVTVEIAARRLVERSHRLATEDEIKKFRADQRDREQKCAETERLKRESEGKGISQETAAAIGTAFGQAVASRPGRPANQEKG